MDAEGTVRLCEGLLCNVGAWAVTRPGILLRCKTELARARQWSALFLALVDYTPDESAAIYGGIETLHCGSCVAVECCVIVDHSVILVVDAGRVQ